MVMARGGNRRTIFHICPICGKKKYYVRGGYNLRMNAHCQYCDYTDYRTSEIDRVLREED